MAFTVKAARYGIGTGPEESVDVTRAVQKVATKKGLAIARVDNTALGVGPIFPGLRKRLYVSYKNGGVASTASALERKSLKIGKS